MLCGTMHTPKNNLHTHNKAQALLLQRLNPNKGMPHTKMRNRTTDGNKDTTINYNNLTGPKTDTRVVLEFPTK